MGIISDTLKLNGVDKLYFFPDSLAIGTIDKFEYLIDGLIECTWRPNDGFLFPIIFLLDELGDEILDENGESIINN